MLKSHLSLNWGALTKPANYAWLLRHPQAKIGRGVHPSHNAQAELHYLPGENSSCLGKVVNSTDQWTWTQPAAVAGLMGWWTAPCVCRVTVSRVDLMLQCWMQLWLHHWDLRGRAQAPGSAFLEPMELRRLAALSQNLPRPTGGKLLPFVLLFFSYPDWKHFNFEMSQLYKKEKCI